MAVVYPDDLNALGAEMQAQRTLAACFEENTLVDGSNNVRDKINAAYANNSQRPDETEGSSKANLLEVIGPALADAHEARKAAFEAFFFTFLKDRLGLSDDELARGAIEYEYDEDLIASTGQVVILKKRGVFGRLAEDMDAQGTPQRIKENDITFGSLTADDDNFGALVDTGITVVGSDHSLSGTLIIECVDDTVGATKFSVKLVFTKILPSGEKERVADQLATLGQSFEDGKTGVTIQLDYDTITESGDGGAIFSAWDVDDESEGDSNRGRFYIKITRLDGTGNKDFRVEVFNSDLRDEDSRVGTRDIEGTSGALAIEISCENGTIINTTVSRTAAATALPNPDDTDDDIYIDLGHPRVGDIWTKTVTNDNDGFIATQIGERWPASLPSNDSPTITDPTALAMA